MRWIGASDALPDVGAVQSGRSEIPLSPDLVFCCDLLRGIGHAVETLRPGRRGATTNEKLVCPASLQLARYEHGKLMVITYRSPPESLSLFSAVFVFLQAVFIAHIETMRSALIKLYLTWVWIYCSCPIWSVSIFAPFTESMQE